MEIENILNSSIGIKEANYTYELTEVNNKKDQEEKVELKDTIQLSSDENAVNSKKAFDALCEVSKKVGTDNENKVSFHVEFLMVMNWMKNDGIAVPNFTDKNDMSFIDFIDKMKSYVLESTSTKGLKMSLSTGNFLDFCDLYKQKLIEIGCK